MVGIIGVAVIVIVAVIFWKSVRTNQAERNRLANLPPEETESAMIDAVKKAKASLGDFIAVLQHPGPNVSYFAIRVKLEDGGMAEYVWLNFVGYDGKEFTGDIANDPGVIRKYSFGQTIVVPPDRVADWMYIDDGYLVGGYTLRVLRSRLPANEQQSFDQRGGFRVREP